FLSPFHFGKVVVFRSMIEVMAVLYLALILQDRRYLPKTNLLFWAITAFTLIFGITSLTGINTYQSMMGTLERMGGWFSFLHFWLLYVMAVSVLRTKDDWTRLIRISVMASFISILYGFLQKTDWEFIIGGGGRPRIFGTLGNTALFAGYTIVNMYLALLLIWQKPGLNKDLYYEDLVLLMPVILGGAIFAGPFFGWPLLIMMGAAVLLIGFGVVWAIGNAFGMSVRFLPVSYGIIALASLVAILMTAVRGSWLAVLASIALFALLYMMTGTSRRLKITFISIALVLITAEGILIASHNTNFVRSSGYLTRLSDISLKTRLIKTRFWAWQAGVDGWNDSAKTVLVGWGPENFNVPFSKHFNPKFFQGPGSETLFDRAHNMFVEVLVTMGVLGIGSYLGIFGVLFWIFWKMYRRPEPEQRLHAITLASGLVAYMIHNAFIFDTSANFIAFFIFMGFVHHLSAPAPEREQKQIVSKSAPATLSYSAAFALGVLVIISIYKTNIKPVQSNYASTRATIASWKNDHPAAIAKFRQAFAYDTFPVYEIRHRYAQYALENYGKFKTDQGLNAGEILLQVIEEVKKNISYQQDYLPYLYISRAYIILGKSDSTSPFNDLALQNSMKALEISPTFVRTYYEVAQAYINKKDYPKAIATFQRAADLNPEVGLSWWYLGLTQVESGDIERGLASIRTASDRGYSMGEGDILRLINVYAEQNNFREIVPLYEQLVKLQPSNPQYHASLATAYAQIGKIDEAVAEARIAAKLSPSFEPEARKFVEGLGRTW
ncbi:MAG: tetratricopeptide repeat protein, partial [Patescibacteria group bacterium]